MTFGRSTFGKILEARWLYIRKFFSESFWFAPSLLLVGGVLLAALALTLDRMGVGGWLNRTVLFFPLTPDITRPILATVATGMVTASTLVFSLIFVALTIASQQLGPRIISRAMADPTNRGILGTFVSTFVYALIILGVNGGETAPAPYTSITVLFGLVLVNFAYLFYFVHHNALSCQADAVLSWLAAELMGSIRESFPARDSDRRDGDAEEESPGVPEEALLMRSRRSGYVEVIGFDALVRLAQEKNLRIWLRCQPGTYVVAGEPIVHVIALDGTVGRDDREEIHAAVVLGPKRTAAQDFAFQMRAIVDIGVRALSPSLNDFHTANSAIDWISGALTEVLARRMPPTLLRDADGALRVVKDPVSFRMVMVIAYQQLFEAAQGHLAVLLHLVRTLTVLGGLARGPAERAVIGEFGGKVEEAIGRMELNRADRKRAEAYLADLRQACAERRVPRYTDRNP